MCKKDEKELLKETKKGKGEKQLTPVLCKYLQVSKFQI